VEGDGWQYQDVVYEEGGRVSQCCDGVVSVPWVLGLVRGGTPVEVQKEVGLGGNFPTRYQSGTVGREGGDGLREACSGRVYLRGGADEPLARKAALVAYQNRQRGETGFPVQVRYVGRGEAVSYPPTDPMPKNGHGAHDRRGRVPDSGPI